MLVSPSISLADEVINESVAEEDANPDQEIEEEDKEEAQAVEAPTSKEAPDLEENAAKEEKTEEPKEVKEEAKPAEVQGAEKSEEPKEEVSEEKAENEATVDLETQENTSAEEISEKENVEEKETNEPKLEIGDLDKHQVGSGEENNKSKDISNKIINPRVSIRTQNTTTPGTLDAGLGEQLTWGVSFTTPEETKEGDTFTVKLSDNMSLKGLEPDTDYALPVKFGDKIIATAKRIDRQTIQYTFTKDIEDMKYARVYIINSAQENKDVVKNSGNQTFKINVGEKAKDEQDINVDFGKVYHAETSENVNGKSQFTEFNPEDGNFTQVFYLNPESKVINTSSTNDQNGREFGKVGFLLSSPHDADKPRSIDYLENNTKIEVKKLPKGAKLPDAIIENPEGAQPATKVEGGFRNFKGEPMFTMNFGGGNKIDSPYVVVVKGHANKIDGKYNNLYSNGTLYGDGEASLFLDNLYTVQENNTDAEGVKETLGYFKEHHIYITKKDGKETSRFEIPGATVSGTADQYYYTDKNIIPEYRFVKVDTDKLVNNPAYNAQGEITKGHFEVGKTKEVTYIYEKDIKKGSFKETHVYKTLDFEGNVVEGKTITEAGKSSEGTKDEPYTSAKVDKAGYVLDKVTADEGSDEVTISKDGKSIEAGNYVEDKELAVTYEYVKQPGRFIEHHIYKTVDKDGNEVSTDKTVNNPKEGEPAKEGYSNEKITTTQRHEDGYEFKSETTLESENYVPGKTLEKIYVYVKKEVKQIPLEETGKFQEHHIYITKDKDEKETGREVVDGDVSGGTNDMSYETGKKEKDGFEFVRTETPVEEPTFNEDGSEATGKFKPGVTQEITYVYEKIEIPMTPLEPSEPVEAKGTFTENHVYEVYKDGKLVETSKITMRTTEGTSEEYFTTSAKPYGTKDQPKEGFTLVKELISKTLDVKSELTGDEINEHYKDNKHLQVRYVYRKDITTPVNPSEPENPTPVKPNEPCEPEEPTPVEPEKPSEPTTPTTPSEPEEPTVPSTPEEPTVPSTPEKPTVPSTPDEPIVPSTPEEPEETTPLIPLTPAEPVEKDETQEEVEEESQENKEIKNKDNVIKTPVRVPNTSKTGNPKTGVASSLGIMGTLTASALAFIGLDDKKRKNK